MVSVNTRVGPVAVASELFAANCPFCQMLAKLASAARALLKPTPTIEFPTRSSHNAHKSSAILRCLDYRARILAPRPAAVTPGVLQDSTELGKTTPSPRRCGRHRQNITRTDSRVDSKDGPRNFQCREAMKVGGGGAKARETKMSMEHRRWIPGAIQ